jgi:hypothetical protein
VARQLATEHFQVCQPDLDTIELVYVPDRHANAPDEAGVAELFARLLGKPVRLKLRPVDEIARTTGGKRELIVSQIA